MSLPCGMSIAGLLTLLACPLLAFFGISESDMAMESSAEVYESEAQAEVAIAVPELSEQFSYDIEDTAYSVTVDYPAGWIARSQGEEFGVATSLNTLLTLSNGEGQIDSGEYGMAFSVLEMDVETVEELLISSLNEDDGFVIGELRLEYMGDTPVWRASAQTPVGYGELLLGEIDEDWTLIGLGLASDEMTFDAYQITHDSILSTLRVNSQ